MTPHQRYNRRGFKWAMACLVLLLIANIATYAAIRPPQDPPVTVALPAVCLSGATVCTGTDYMRGDFNVNGKLDAGDILILTRAVMGIE